MPTRQGATRPSAGGLRKPARTSKTPSASSSTPAVDHATLAFIRRTLCPDLTASSTALDTTETGLPSSLPPLTSSNDIDLQLYAIIAVVLNQFLQTWYTRITDDADFITEVVHTIAHCTRALEQRCRRVDFEDLLLNELPLLLDTHVRGLRASRDTGAVSVPQIHIIFHALFPHVALSPAPVDHDAVERQADNEIAWCQLLVSKFLPLVLPPEQVQNPCLGALVSEVLSQVILYNAVCAKITEPWMLWDGITKAIEAIQPRREPSKTSQQKQPSDLEPQSALPSAVRRLRIAVNLILALPALLQSYISVLVSHYSNALQESKEKAAKTRPTTSSIQANTINERPIVNAMIWTFLSTLLLLPDRMPWLLGLLNLFQWLLLRGPGKVGQSEAPLNRFLSLQFHERILNQTATAIPSVLRVARTALFPDNTLAPPRKPPSPSETLEIRDRCARAIVDCIPRSVRRVYFATLDVELMVDDVKATLDIFADQYVNKHLLCAAIDLLALRLFPELATSEYDD